MPTRRISTRALAVTAAGVLGAAVMSGSAEAVERSALVKGTPCAKTAQACVDLKAKRAWLVKDGKVTRGPVPIETGGPGKETPVGTFVVQWKNKNHRSSEFNNAPMPFAVFFADGGIAFHQGTLQRQSAGCVRLTQADAVAFYDTLELGDQVQISPGPATGTDPKPGKRGDREKA